MRDFQPEKEKSNHETAEKTWALVVHPKQDAVLPIAVMRTNSQNKEQAITHKAWKKP